MENQNIIVRYIRLDQLLRKPGGVTLKEILEDPQMDDISKRRLQENLKELEDKFGAVFEDNMYRGRERLWRYHDTSFSIMRQATADMEVIRKTIEGLSLFQGDPRYDMLRYYLMGLEKGITDGGLRFMSFDYSSEVAGLKHVETVLDAITHRYPLKMTYRTFSGKEVIGNIHPCHLRQYNKRWYVFAYTEEKEQVQNYPLDRIVDLKHLSKPYIETDIDFDEYFDDIVGVSDYADRKVERIVLRVSRKSIDYIRTKPLHGSQTELKELETDESVFMQLEVKVNTELKMLLLSYGDAMEVMEPAWLRDDFRCTTQKMAHSYEV